MDYLEKREYQISGFDVEKKQNKIVYVTITCKNSYDGRFKAIEKVSNEHPEWIHITKISDKLIDLVR